MASQDHSRIGLEYNNNGAGDGEKTVGSTVGYVHGGVLSTVGQGHVEMIDEKQGFVSDAELD